MNGQTGPSTGVQPAAVPAHDGFADPSRARPVSGGGLAAAIATSGHKPTKQDKKALKTEIRDEKKYEKNLKKEAILERAEIEAAAKQAKKSDKKAAKSASYEASFRSTYEKAIKKEVRAKQHLLKITNEYNKVAADLERATKEMEIRRNNHLADQQTRDADQQKVDDLRHRKGQNDVSSAHFSYDRNLLLKAIHLTDGPRRQTRTIHHKAEPGQACSQPIDQAKLHPRIKTARSLDYF